MALNPLAYTESVVGSFLRYQLTTYPFADANLYDQMRALLSLEETRQTPLLKGPFVSLSRSFAEGARIGDLVQDGVLHPFMRELIECGQHYFEHAVEDFEFGAKVPAGGVPTAEGGRSWPAKDLTVGGRRIVVFDRLVAESDDDHDDGKGAAGVWLCRICGAIHPDAMANCRGCGHRASLVPLFVVRDHKDHPGQLTRCLSCGAPGRARGSGYREPARPVRAVNVADVHVLAQEMLRYAERKRLLVFADNRQDAAFQAGWMRDHARRFRLRAVMAERLDAGASSGHPRDPPPWGLDQ